MLRPEYKKFGEILSSSLFRIPTYQRAYSWQQKHRRDLFQDPRKVSEMNGVDHFMATVVCFNQESTEVGTEEIAVYDIVDGQQRITSLIILLKALPLSQRSCPIP